MKRYLAFYGDFYYPQGGMDDFQGDYDTIEEAKEAIRKAHLENRIDDIKWEWSWFHIWDMETKEKIENISLSKSDNFSPKISV
ncbi:MAG: hypothetical protein ACUZ8H_03200 [Candidatus Anammoxibacter sp.]